MARGPVLVPAPVLTEVQLSSRRVCLRQWHLVKCMATSELRRGAGGAVERLGGEGPAMAL